VREKYCNTKYVEIVVSDTATKATKSEDGARGLSVLAPSIRSAKAPTMPESNIPHIANSAHCLVFSRHCCGAAFMRCIH
jgi:hypothetical protein